jgi:HD-like signal output (HDOD) protein
MPEFSKQTAPANELARPVNLPPRPSLLIALQHEMTKEYPHVGKIAHLLDRDAAISGNILAIANSAMFNLHWHVETVENAISLIGLSQCKAMATGLMARRAMAHGRMMMPRFWDVSEKRSWAMMQVAVKLKIAPPDMAHNFGLFLDMGIPLMIASFPNYAETLQMANQMEIDRFTELENARHQINHAVVGAILAEHWNIDANVVLAIRHHHSFEALKDDGLSLTVRGLIAVHLIVEKAIQEHRHASPDEWKAGGAQAREMLGLSDADVEEICAELKNSFLRPHHV